MRRSRKAAGAAAIGLALAGLLAGATGPRLADIEAVCPLFGHRFVAQSAVEDPEVAAFDSDLCRRPPGTSPYLLAVWTCPYCFFSAYQADFRGTLEPRFRDLALKTYPLDPKNVEQVDIFPATKYLNAEAYYRLAGKDARFLADLALRGSYACRVAEVKEPPEIDPLWRALRDEVMEGKRRISVEEVHLAMAERLKQRLDAGEIAPDRERIYRYLLAAALREGGERIAAGALFAALEKDFKLADAYRTAARQKGLLCEREGMFQEKTLAYLRQAEAEGKVPDAERAVVAYLEGEMSRRLGKADDARREYDRAAALPGGPEWLPSMIRKQRDRLPAPAAPEPATP